MKKKFWILTILVLILAASLSGCLPSSEDYDALCKDKKAAYCEDFESNSPQVQYVSIAGTEWYAGSDDRLVNWRNDLPVDGRSQQFLASVGMLLGEYEDHSKAILLTPTIDLSDVASARLSFNLMFLTEKNWDGMLVVASIDRGISWIVLDPAEGYPGTLRVGKEIIPGYSGFQSYWSHEEVDLSLLLGSEAILGFYFISDGSITNHGVAIDDIVVNTDSRIFVSQVTKRNPFSDVNLILSSEPLISTGIPAAIAFIDTPCVSGGTEILKESHQAYVKAINQTSDRYLVLHPESGDFCWVWFEDVWIDTSEIDLPRLSDLNPEDTYLPFCSFSKSPSISEPSCINDPASDGQIHYSATSALVANGKIITLLIDPDSRQDVVFLQEEELRVGDRSLFDQYEPAVGPAGNISVIVNGTPEDCSFDKLKPGRIICDGTSIDAAGPLQIEMCWQGWDENQDCPPGFGASNDDQRCYLLGDGELCKPDCPAGYKYNNGTKTCLIDRDLSVLKRPDELCPDGYQENPDANCCVAPEIHKQLECPAGFYYLPEKAACQKLPVDAGCPEGLVDQENNGICLPEIGASSKICSAVEVRFPKLEVTVKEAAKCWRGPGDSYETVSSLTPFTVVEVVGISVDEKFLVIYNQKYQSACWAYLDDFYWDKLNLSILPHPEFSPEN